MEDRPAGRRGWVWFGLVLVVIAGAAVYEWPLVKAWTEQHAAPVLALAGIKPTATGEPTQSAATPTQSASAPVPVTIATAKVGDYPVVLTSLGLADAYNSVLVRTRVDGQIIKLNFKEGDLVNTGDVLVEIDPRPYKAALEQAQAKKQQDEANLANAKRDLDRYQSLAKSDFATRQQLDTQTAQVAQLTAQIAADQAAIDNAQTQLDYTVIKAPIKGRVGFRLVDLGNIVNAASTTGIVEINQIKPIAVIFTEPEEVLPQIAAGMAKGPLPVTALSTDGSLTLGEGELEVVNNQVDQASGTIRLKARFPNPEKKLWPGLSVSTRMTVSTRQNVVLIPANAVQRGQSGFYTFVVGSDDKVEVRKLKISLMDQSQAVIDDGVKDGEKVVTAGQYRLAQGVTVTATGLGEKTAAAGN